MFSNNSTRSFSQKKPAKRSQDDRRLSPFFYKRPVISKKTANVKKSLSKQLFDCMKKRKYPANIEQHIETVSLPIVKFDDEADMPVETKIIRGKCLLTYWVEACLWHSVFFFCFFFEEVSFNHLGDEYKTDVNNKKNEDKNFHGLNMKKIRHYMITVLKFSFSQIGLAGLVVAYVILGAIIIMKIENAYEKIKKEKLQNTREEFVRNVRMASEGLVNEYLRKHFHEKYNQFRDEEIHCAELGLKVLGRTNETNDLSRSVANQMNQTVVSHDADNQTVAMPSAKKCDVEGLWFIKIDDRQFRNQMISWLDVFLNEIDKNEDKDKSSNSFDEDVWTYSSSLLFSVTVITTIG
jgi:hypothetical protein